jgi:EAL domain-containing protein (putative c-di-GMP-specific phosphodiesterase class I)
MLEIEITENVLMEDLENVISVLERISALGISIAIDDFGTGYSSLNYLQKLPIDTLKIDQSFVQDMESDQGAFSIVKAIIEMARGLKLQIISEGVEEISQFELLKSMGCRNMQGYLFGRPVPMLDITELMGSIKNGNRRAMGELLHS